MADTPGIQAFEFDGNGNKLILPEDMSPLDAIPLILVGPQRTLVFKNVTIVHASSLSSVLQLKAGEPWCSETSHVSKVFVLDGRILLNEEDGVHLVEHMDRPPVTVSGSNRLRGRSSLATSQTGSDPVRLSFEIRALGHRQPSFFLYSV